MRLIDECLQIAQQAPTPSHMQNWHFIVVTDAERRAGLAEIYRMAVDIYRTLPIAADNLPYEDPQRRALQQRVMSSIVDLAEHMHEVPVLVFACVTPRADGQPLTVQGAMWSTISHAGWSFMLAARARGLGTVWTCLHLMFEKETAELLGIHEEVMQAGLIPVAHTKGSRSSRRPESRSATWCTGSPGDRRWRIRGCSRGQQRTQTPDAGRRQTRA